MESRASSAPPTLTLTRDPQGALVATLAGTWLIGHNVPEATALARELDVQRPDRVVFDTGQVVTWDSALVAFAVQAIAIAREAGVAVERSGLPSGVQRLITLAEATPAKEPVPTPAHRSLFTRIGLHALGTRDRGHHVLVAIGELAMAFTRLALGRAKLHRSDLFLHMQAAGVDALGIVGLVSGLVGLILAFVAAVQLQGFGASLYVANLVGIATVRELAAVMTAIVVAGRTGAAFAAELGTMRVTQEIDALTTLGLSPTEFLVVPRVLAVTLMMPLLCVYADIIGVAGGAIVGIGVMHVAPRLYVDQTLHAVTLMHLFGGLLKATTYGFLVATVGCMIGLRAGRSAADVGRAATSAVVDGIVLTILACGLYAVVFYRLGL